MNYRLLLLFLVLNFGALGIGSYLMADGPMGEWYQGLNKAPWTPPGWVFGAAWTTIMICFSIYMAFTWEAVGSIGTKALGGLFAVQWILNIGWNPAFFMFHHVWVALVIISILACLMTYFLFRHWSLLKNKSLLLLPYVVWLFIATSLNAYVCLMN